MAKFIVGKKIGMSQIFDKERKVIPVTIIYAPAVTAVQVKTEEKDGYGAVQFGAGTRKEKNIKKPQRGHMKDLEFFEVLKEAKGFGGVERGAKIDVTQFQEGDKVMLSGVSKAKGFQGVVKRHGFHGAPATHGTKHAHREPGSIGPTWPQRVLKGRRMAGRMGGDRITLKTAKIAKVDAENNILAIKGPVPGRRGTLIEIRG
ncbi:MAG: 50S ribosomal protein L3 [bacterium]|nr:50S ribosomal protein L3 [bacterium]